MGGTECDIVAIGNAMIDVVAQVPDAFIDEHNLDKGCMTLIEEERALKLFDAMPDAVEVPGGSVANTAATAASLGARAAYIGKVADDRLGALFGHNMRKAGVSFDAPVAAVGHTARCMIQVTPDAERTMNTYLGVSGMLTPEDIDSRMLQTAHIVYCEGYLWDSTPARDAALFVIKTAGAIGVDIALTLSDAHCVERHRDEWLSLVQHSVDIVFGNDAELMALHATDNLDEAMHLASETSAMVVVTHGANGSTVLRNGARVYVPACDVKTIVDTTGAGDSYAAGFLHAYCQQMSVSCCASLGSVAAALTLQSMGARPNISYSTAAHLADLSSRNTLH